MDIIKKLAQELAIKEEQAKAAVQLIYMNAFSIFAT